MEFGQVPQLVPGRRHRDRRAKSTGRSALCLRHQWQRHYEAHRPQRPDPRVSGGKCLGVGRRCADLPQVRQLAVGLDSRGQLRRNA